MKAYKNPTVKSIKDDFKRLSYKPTIISFIKNILLNGNHSLSFLFWLRLSGSNNKNIIRSIARRKHHKLSIKLGLHIDYRTKIGNGLFIGHPVGIVINPTAEIGVNCNLSQFTTIGSNEGKAAVIGDNVYIGPSVCIVENVNIGNNVTIGAGSVVTKDIPDNATVAGVPATILSYKTPGRFILNRCFE